MQNSETVVLIAEFWNRGINCRILKPCYYLQNSETVVLIAEYWNRGINCRILKPIHLFQNYETLFIAFIAEYMKPLHLLQSFGNCGINCRNFETLAFQNSETVLFTSEFWNFVTYFRILKPWFLLQKFWNRGIDCRNYYTETFIAEFWNRNNHAELWNCGIDLKKILKPRHYCINSVT